MQRDFRVLTLRITGCKRKHRESESRKLPTIENSYNRKDRSRKATVYFCEHGNFGGKETNDQRKPMNIAIKNFAVNTGRIVKEVELSQRKLSVAEKKHEKLRR